MYRIESLSTKVKTVFENSQSILPRIKRPHHTFPKQVRLFTGLLFAFCGLLVLNLYLLQRYVHARAFERSQEALFAELQLTKEGTVADTQHMINQPAVLGAFEPAVGVADGRAANLRRVLKKYNSPLYDSADYMVAKADEYGFHYGLLFAIAMQESQGCKVIPPGSHNCWGYGIYGDTVTTFTSYNEAIDTVSAGIYKNYIQKGLTTPKDIMSRYTPNSDGSWAYAVNFFFDKLLNE